MAASAAKTRSDRVQSRERHRRHKTLCIAVRSTRPATFTTYTEVVEVPGGTLICRRALPFDLAAKKRDIDRSVRDYNSLAIDKNSFRNLYLLLLSLITLFILFFATWLARYLAGQISTPITALLEAAQQIRKGNLGYRVNVAAIDELATLVRAFNEMTEGLETNSQELEAAGRFTEAILESIPTGVISLSARRPHPAREPRADGHLPRRAGTARATPLEDCFPREDANEIRYLMNRARRTGVAGTQTRIQIRAARPASVADGGRPR